MTKYLITFKWSNGAALTMVEEPTEEDDAEYFGKLGTGLFTPEDPEVVGWMETFSQADYSPLNALQEYYWRSKAQMISVFVSRRSLDSPRGDGVS